METVYEYEPCRWGYVKRLSDGAELHQFSKEVREARARGSVAPGVKRAARGGVRLEEDSGGDDASENGPKKVRPPRAIPTAPRLTKKAQAKEYGVLVGLFFQGIALARGPHWMLAGEQQDEWGDAIAGVAPQLPKEVATRIAMVGPWAKLAMVAQSTIVPRVIEDARYAAQARATKREGGVTPAPTQQQPTQTQTPTNGQSVAEGHANGEHVVPIAPEIPGIGDS